MNYNRLWARKV